jgi:hypothetical protein
MSDDITPPVSGRPAPENGLRRRADQFGIGLAGLCAVHCVATVLIVSGLGIGGHFLLAHEIHEVGLGLAVIVAAIALGAGATLHRRKAPLLIAALGLAIMAFALLLGHGAQEALLTIIGVAIVSIAHLMNLRAAH